MAIGKCVQGNYKSVESAGTFVCGTNVRRDEYDQNVLRPAGVPAVVRNDSWKPLQRVSLPEAGVEAVFMQSGSMLGVIVYAHGQGQDSVDVLKGTVHEIGQPGGRPLRFDVVEPGIVRVLMKHSPTAYITYSLGGGSGEASFLWHGVMPELPAMSVSVAGEVAMSEDIGMITLQGGGASGNTLNSGDLATLTGTAVAAYTRLKRRASEAGYYLQPTIARYRLLDAAGDTIVASAPVLVCSEAGFQLCGDVTFTSADGLATLGGNALSGKVYRLALSVPGGLPAPWNRIVRRIVVETLSQIDPVDLSGVCAATVTPSGSSATTVNVRLPGVHYDSAVNSARQRALVVDALGGSASRFGTQACIERPFDGASRECIVGLHDFDPAENDGAVSYPLRDHVSYGACGEIGQWLVLSDMRTEGFNGYSPLNFAVSCKDVAGGGWQGAVSVTVERGDGNTTVAVATGWGEGLVIEGLSPLLVYPDASATEMTVTLATTGHDGNKSIQTETYHLTPLPEAGMAYYLADDIEPMMPRGFAGSFVVPEPSVTDEWLAGTVAVCHPLHLSSPLSVTRCSPGAVVAVTEAPRSRATWDFSRHKMLLFGEAGTHVATLGKDAGIVSVALLDNRSVRRSDAVCQRVGDSGLELLAVAGGDLVSVGQSRVRTLVRHCQGEVSGWCGTYGEIWLAGGTQMPLRRLCSYGKRFEEIFVEIPSVGSSAELVCYDGHLLLATSVGLLDTSSEGYPPGGTYIKIRFRHDLRKAMDLKQALRLRPSAMPRLLRLWLTALEVSGRITVSADRGTRVAEPLVALDVDGSLNAPSAIGIAAPLREWLETGVEAWVSADAEWHPVELIYEVL